MKEILSPSNLFIDRTSLFPINVTDDDDDDIFICFNDEQHSKSPSSMVDIAEGIFICSNEQQP